MHNATLINWYNGVTYTTNELRNHYAGKIFAGHCDIDDVIEICIEEGEFDPTQFGDVAFGLPVTLYTDPVPANADYTYFYGTEVSGNTLCADHQRLIERFQGREIEAYSRGDKTEINALAQKFNKELALLLANARANGDEYLVPRKDYAFLGH